MKACQILLAALFLVGTSAFAQVSASASANTKVRIANPITLTASGTLNFGTIAKQAAASTGSVTIDHTTAATALVAGSNLQILTTGADTPTTPTFTVGGEPNTAYTITLPTTVSVGTGLALNSFTASTALSTTLSGSGAGTFKVGATLQVDAGAAAGTYTTATVNVTVTYN